MGEIRRVPTAFLTFGKAAGLQTRMKSRSDYKSKCQMCLFGKNVSFTEAVAT
jgi:hypothetical protein